MISVKQKLEEIDILPIEKRLPMDDHLDHLDTELDSMISDIYYIFQSDSDYVSWIEIIQDKSKYHISCHAAPINCKEILNHSLFNRSYTCQLLSATLTVKK